MIALLLATTPASAVQVPVTVCVKGSTDFVDADSTYGDDLWTGNAAKKMRGIYIQIKDANDWFSSNVWGGYVSHETGCVDVSLEAGTSHWIKVTSKLDMDGREVWITDGNLFGVMSSGSITPVSGQTYTYTMDGSASGMEWVNVAAAAGWVMKRRLNTWPALSQRYEIALQDHPSPDHTTAYQPYDATVAQHGYDADGGVIYINPNGVVPDVLRKYVIAHEMGHMLLHFSYWNDSPLDMSEFAFSIDYDLAVDGDCEGGAQHTYNSKEYQGAAIIEGHAHYVAAVAFNHTGSTTQTNYDCKMVPSGPVSWDDDVLPSGSYDAFSCEGAEGNDAGGVEYSVYDVDARDYMGDYCLGSTNGNRGTEYDWLRFFWDADTDDGVTVFSMGDSVDILVYSDPANWRATDSGTDTFPMHAVRNAFDDTYGLGFESVWDDWAATNGVER